MISNNVDGNCSEKRHKFDWSNKKLKKNILHKEAKLSDRVGDSCLSARKTKGAEEKWEKLEYIIPSTLIHKISEKRVQLGGRVEWWVSTRRSMISCGSLASLASENTSSAPEAYTNLAYTMGIPNSIPRSLWWPPGAFLTFFVLLNPSEPFLFRPSLLVVCL